MVAWILVATAALGVMGLLVVALARLWTRVERLSAEVDRAATRLAGAAAAVERAARGTDQPVGPAATKIVDST
jgi:Tfp pilus assembly protein PilX